MSKTEFSDFTRDGVPDGHKEMLQAGRDRDEFGYLSEVLWSLILIVNLMGPRLT